MSLTELVLSGCVSLLLGTHPTPPAPVIQRRLVEIVLRPLQHVPEGQELTGETRVAAMVSISEMCRTP